jgi:ferritin-like metal-binding protein YciE
MQELLVDQLRDLYDAEKQLTKALPKLAKASKNPELAQGFRDHLEQTQGHVQRIEQIFGILGQKAKSKPCEAMKGLVAEGQEAIAEDLDPETKNIALIAAARRVEHYEMAAYGTLVMAAQAMKQPEIARLLQATLQEETETDKKLAASGKTLLKEAVRPDGEATTKSAPSKAKSSPAKSSPAKSSASRKPNGHGHLSHTTSDHDEIRRWAEARGGKPACVQGTGGKGDIGLIRIEFPGKPNANDSKLEEISWDEFFDKFDQHGLSLVYQEKTAEGRPSNFNKLVANTESERKPKTRSAR